MKERVQAAAIIAKDGRIFKGPTHIHAYEDAEENGYKERDIVDDGGGFVTTFGRYVSRHEASVIAQSEKQLSSSVDMRGHKKGDPFEMDTTMLKKERSNPMNVRANPRRTVTDLLSTVLEPGDRVLDYDRANGEDFYRLYDVIHTDMPLNETSLTEIEGMLDDKGVLCIMGGEEPSGLETHFKKWGRHRGMLMVQGPKNPEAARIAAEKERNS